MTLGSMQFFYTTQPRGPTAHQKPVKAVCFQVGYLKVGNFGVLHQKELEGDPESLTFGSMQLFDTTLPKGSTGS